MSYDFYLCAKQGTTPAKVFASLKTEPKMVFQEGATETEWQCLYQNPNTGVYFILESEPLDEEDAKEMLPEGYTYLHTAIHLNFARPVFFAVEFYVEMAELLQKYGWMVFDPQSEEIRDESNLKYFLDQWLTVSDSTFAQVPLEKRWVLDAKKAMEAWEYNYYTKPSLHKIFEQELQAQQMSVATVYAYKDTTTGTLDTCFMWPETIPQNFPPEAYNVFIVVQKKGFFGPKDEERLVPYEEFFEAMKQFFIQDPETRQFIMTLETFKEHFDEIRQIASTLGKPVKNFEASIIGMDQFQTVEVKE